MAYDRYDRDDRHDEWRGSRREQGRGRDERGFFGRAGDEVRSWFGDDRDDHREGMSRGRDQDRGYGRDYDRDRRDFDEGDRRSAYGRGREDDRNRDYGRRNRGADPAFRPMGWSMSDRDYESGSDRSFERRDYKPVTGDYGRGSGDDGRRNYGRESEWDRDEYRRTSFAGSSARSQHDDPHYEEWRHRQMSELDRDYDDYRREHQSRFDEHFAGWREKRQTKRQMLGQIREHMEVIGKDENHVGTVDRVAGDRIILTKSDPESGGTHHSISCTMIEGVDDNRVMLDVDADKARERWRDESRDRALFEREDQGRAGPGILDRSFSGTYR